MLIVFNTLENSSVFVKKKKKTKETKESKESQTLVVSNEREGVYLYATPNFKNNRFTNFQVKIGKETVETFGWESSMREERQPELHVVDLNHDGQNETVVIITKGTGTWVVVKEAHILQKVDTPYGKAYEEMDIDDPVHTVERDFDITATDKTILVRGRGRQWKGTNPCGETYSHHRFPAPSIFKLEIRRRKSCRRSRCDTDTLLCTVRINDSFTGKKEKSSIEASRIQFETCGKFTAF